MTIFSFQFIILRLLENFMLIYALCQLVSRTHTVYIQCSMLRYSLYALYQGVASIFTRLTTILNESVINAFFKLPSHLESADV